MIGSKVSILFYFSTVLLLSCGHQPLPIQEDHSKDLVQADSCDNPDANINCCFVHMPAAITNVMTLSHGNDPGDSLFLSGTVFHQDGVTPYPAVILYAYHTDHTGHYTKKGAESGVQKWHGHLHGWCKTDENGHYEIRSIRPVPYPGNTVPAHIHCAVKEPVQKAPYYINDFVFSDDTLVNKAYLSSLTLTGGTGVMVIKKNHKGVWTGTRNIILP